MEGLFYDYLVDGLIIVTTLAKDSLHTLPRTGTSGRGAEFQKVLQDFVSVRFHPRGGTE